MTPNALDTCNACDAIGVDPDSLAGYCPSCEREALATILKCRICGKPTKGLTGGGIVCIATLNARI